MRNWEELAAPWLKHEARMETAHRPVLDAMLSAAGLAPGERVLDIGMGSGLSTSLAAKAVGPDGAATGIDVAPPFITRARARFGDKAEFLEGDAQDLDLPAQHFDAAISIFGLMFFADTAAAFANIARAMKPGGRFAFAAWAMPGDNPWLTGPTKVVNAVLGPPSEPADLTAPGPFRFHDPDMPLAALAKAGWRAEHETLTLMLTPDGIPEDIARTQMELGVAARRIREEAASAKQTHDIHAGITALFAAMLDGSGAVKVPARVHIFCATIG